MSKSKTPPAEFDRQAMEIARNLASIDRARLPGSTTQFVAILHEAIVNAMMFAFEDTGAAAIAAELRDCAETQTCESGWTCAACSPSRCDGRSFCGRKLVPPAGRYLGSVKSC